MAPGTRVTAFCSGVPWRAEGAARSRAAARVTGVRGQAAVELVALLPLAMTLLLAGWQIVLLGQAAWSVHAAARAAARAQAIGGDELRAARRSLPANLDGRLRLAARRDDDAPGVTLRLRVPMLVPGIPEPTVSASSSFAEQA